MLNKVVTYLQFGNRFCGIEHTFVNGKDTIIVSVLKKTKNEVDVDTSFQTETIEDVAEQLPKKQHAHLIINNAQVLSKSIESEQRDGIKLVYKAFPNINLNDFYFEILHQNNHSFISLCRKQYVDNLIDSYHKLGISIINVSLGNHAVSNVTAFVNTDTITTSNALISIENSVVKNIAKQDAITDTIEYDINGLQVNNLKLLSLSGALESVLNQNISEGNFNDKQQILLNEYKQTRFFSLFLKFGLIFILGLLLINFFVFNHYFNNVNDLKQVSKVNLDTKNTVLQLNDVVSKKQKMVEDLLKSNVSKSSFYANEIIQSLPNTILLSQLNYQPLEKRIKKEQPIAISNHVIVVSGKTTHSDFFSNWIAQLETKTWVKTVAIADYGSASNNSSDFSVKISIANDL